MSTYELNINGDSAKAGSDKIVRSFEDIKAAAARMETSVVKSANAASQAYSSLTGKSVSRQAIDSVRELGSAFRSFKGPSKAAADNTLAFLSGLKSIGSFRISASGIAPVLSALSGFKGPSAVSATNTTKLLSSLKAFTGIGSTRGVAPILSAMANFRGPTANAAKNTRALLAAVSGFTAPKGLGAASRAFIALAEAAQKANRAIREVKGVASGSMNVRVNTRTAQNNLAGLRREHSLLQSAVLKTTTAYHALGSVLGVGLVIRAANEIIKIKAQLEAATGSVQQARVQFGFLRSYAEQLGLEFVNLSKSYGFFLGSIKGTNVTFSEAKEIFVGFTTAARALQLSTSDLDGVFRALGQIMSKGKLQAEELRGQLGDRLPGAFIRFARALDLTKPGELDQALKRGAISGDKLKNAIIEVARSMEQEFAGAADKMSKTVDAAFNRLKNSFTFASDSLGQSGLNEGIINLTDALRKLLESDGFNRAMRLLGLGFKFIGNNIEFFASVLSGLAVASMVKWVGAVTGMTKVAALASLGINGLTAAHMRLGLGSVAATTLTGRLTMALRVLYATMLANPVTALAIAIGAATAAFFLFSDSSNKSRKALLAANDTMGDAQNFYDAYIAKIYDSTAALDAEAQSTRDLMIARIQANLLSEQEVGRTARVAGSIGPVNFVDFGIGKKRLLIDGQVVSSGLEKQLKELVYVNDEGKATLRYFDSKAGATKFVGAAARLEAYAQTAKLSDTDQTALNTVRGLVSGRINTARQAENLGVNSDYSLDEILGTVSGTPDYNNAIAPPGLSGDAPESAAKKARSGGRSPGEVAAEQDAKNIESALRSMRDLNQEIEFSETAIKSLLSGSDAIAVQASEAANKNFNSIMDGFDRLNNPARAESGIMQLAQQMKNAGQLVGEEIGTFQQAKMAIIDYMTVQEEAAARSQNDLKVSNTIADLREENTARGDLILQYAQGEITLSEMNRQLEIESALKGTSLENSQALRKQLDEETKVRDAANRSLEYANELQALQSATRVESEISGLYGRGLPQEDLDYYRELFDLREKLITQGFEGDQLRGYIAARKGRLELTAAVEEAQKEEEKLRQISVDQADAFVSAFREGMTSAKSFGDTIKDLFTSLKNILLDFVLFNPLKQFLTDVFATNNGNAFGNLVGAATNISPSGIIDAQGGLGAILNLSSANDNAPISPTEAANSPSLKAIASGSADATREAFGGIIVDGQRSAEPDLNAPVGQRSAPKTDTFGGLKKIFNWEKNSADLKDAFKGTLEDGIAKVASVGTKAFAAFSAGQGVGKALGLGRTGSNVLGGASAGYSVGGPVGAAVGATVALVASVLFAKKKISESTAITVGANGIAEAGSVSIFGKGDKKAAAARGQAGADLFNSFAASLGGTLTPGDFGTLGAKDFKGDKTSDKIPFYSVTGRLDKKGTPIGREGVDFFKGTDSEVQAFALKTQINRGQITGLSESTRTVARNSKSVTLESLQGDFQVAEAYDSFIKKSFAITDTSRQVKDLDEAFKKLAAQSRRLGLEESKLAQARDRILANLKKDFDFGISQQILGFENPVMQAYNQLRKEYSETVENGLAVGGDLLEVERLFGLKRIEIAKQAAEQLNNVYKDLLTELTASSSSPLNAGTVFANSRDRYTNLRNELASGNNANIGKLSEYTQNYLGAARDVFSSGSGFFDIFNEITSFLSSMSGVIAEGGTSAADLPQLPTLQAIIDEITARNTELVEVNKGVGEIIAGGNAEQLEALKRLDLTLEQIANLLNGGSGGSILPTKGLNILHGNGGGSLNTIQNF